MITFLKVLSKDNLTLCMSPWQLLNICIEFLLLPAGSKCSYINFEFFGFRSRQATAYSVHNQVFNTVDPGPPILHNFWGMVKAVTYCTYNL